ncbi:hypothetical protein [Streptomyces sp. NPDC001137]
MARPVWSGVVTLGLVSVPVALFTATEDHTVQLLTREQLLEALKGATAA